MDIFCTHINVNFQNNLCMLFERLSMSVPLHFSKTLCNLCVDGCTVYSGYPIYWSFKIRHEFIWNDILQKIRVKFQKKAMELQLIYVWYV